VLQTCQHCGVAVSNGFNPSALMLLLVFFVLLSRNNCDAAAAAAAAAGSCCCGVSDIKTRDDVLAMGIDKYDGGVPEHCDEVGAAGAGAHQRNTHCLLRRPGRVKQQSCLAGAGASEVPPGTLPCCPVCSWVSWLSVASGACCWLVRLCCWSAPDGQPCGVAAWRYRPHLLAVKQCTFLALRVLWAVLFTCCCCCWLLLLLQVLQGVGGDREAPRALD